MKLGNSARILCVRMGARFPSMIPRTLTSYLPVTAGEGGVGEGSAGLGGAGLGPLFWTRLGDSCFVTWGTEAVGLYGGAAGLPSLRWDFTITGSWCEGPICCDRDRAWRTGLK